MVRFWLALLAMAVALAPASEVTAACKLAAAMDIGACCCCAGAPAEASCCGTDSEPAGVRRGASICRCAPAQPRQGDVPQTQIDLFVAEEHAAEGFARLEAPSRVEIGAAWIFDLAPLFLPLRI